MSPRCGEYPAVAHFTVVKPGYYREQCCPACDGNRGSLLKSQLIPALAG
jgi:hypothetical protein